MAIVRCPECDGKVSDNAHTCPHCGVSLGTCCECGGLLKLFEEECPHCGASLTWNNSDKDADENKKEGGCLEKVFGCFSLVIIFLFILGLIGHCVGSDSDNKTDKTEQKEAKKTSFLDIGEKSTYIVNFDKDFILARGAEFTLYKDNSGKIDWISPAHDMPPYKGCEWTEREFKNPMSQGGDGKPRPVICVIWDGQIYAIEENKDVYWSTDDTFIKVGTATKK